MFLFWIHLLTWSGFAYINTHTQYTNKCKRTSFILTMQHDRRWSFHLSDNSHYSWVTLHGHLDWLIKLFCKQCFLVHPHAILQSYLVLFFFPSLGLAFFYDDFNIVNDSNDGNKNKKGMLCREKFIHLFYFILASSSTITTWLGYWWICIW